MRSVSSWGSSARLKYCSFPVQECQIYLSRLVTIQWFENSSKECSPWSQLLSDFSGSRTNGRRLCPSTVSGIGAPAMSRSVGIMSRNSATSVQTEDEAISVSTFFPAVMIRGIWQLPSYGRAFLNMWWSHSSSP